MPFCVTDGCHTPSKMLVPMYKISWGHIPEDSIIVKIPDIFKHWHIYLLFYCDYSSVSKTKGKIVGLIATAYHFLFLY
jgi:hypothetical protein